MPVAECRLRFGLPQTVEDFLRPRMYRRRPLRGLLEVRPRTEWVPQVRLVHILGFQIELLACPFHQLSPLSQGCFRLEYQ